MIKITPQWRGATSDGECHHCHGRIRPGDRELLLETDWVYGKFCRQCGEGKAMIEQLITEQEALEHGPTREE